MSDPFDIDFKPLPPKLQMQLWMLAFNANTSKVNRAYRSISGSAGASTTLRTRDSLSLVEPSYDFEDRRVKESKREQKSNLYSL